MANSAAYGFVGLKDQFANRITVVGVETVTTAIEESIAEYQREQAALLQIFVQKVTFAKKRYKLPSGTTLQPLDQWGNPLPKQPSGNYEVALPIQGGGTAWGDNRVTRAKMTVDDANEFTWMVMTDDMDWVVRHVLAAIFTNTTWTYEDPNDEIGDLTIQPLANGDSVVYTRKGGSSSADDHYLAQASSIDDSNNPFPTIKNELMEHPSNKGDIVSYVPTNLVDDIKALTNFIPVEDIDVTPGIGSDTLNRVIDQGVGDEVLGKVDGVWVVEWKRLPDNYIVSFATGADPVVGMREYEEPELQGLFPEFQNVDGNRQLYKFIRYAGFGILNRVGACVMRIGNGSYAIPSGYTAPLAV